MPAIIKTVYRLLINHSKLDVNQQLHKPFPDLRYTCTDPLLCSRCIRAIVADGHARGAVWFDILHRGIPHVPAFGIDRSGSAAARWPIH